MTKRTASAPKSNPTLPPPTRSEAAFERVLRAAQQGTDALTSPSNDALASFVEATFAKKDEYLEDRFASIAGASSFFTKIVGVSFEGRQDHLHGLAPGFELELRRQPDNPKDSHAIAVHYGAVQLGYIRAGIAKHLSPLIDSGVRYRARIASLTGTQAREGVERFRGVNIEVTRDALATLEQRSSVAGARNAWDGDAQRVHHALIGDALAHEAQRAVLERIEAGRNTLAVLGTGRGKSFCFQYPAALRALAGSGKTLVIYPLRALANDQFEALIRRFDSFGLRIHRANGSISAEEREDLFAALASGAWDIILATPEFLEYHRASFSGASVPAFVVVDEAHHLYESKHRSAYGKLGATIAQLGNPQVLALTATAGDEAFAHIVRELRIEAWVVDPTIRENLHVIDARGIKDKVRYLTELVADGSRAIVYCNSRREATSVAETLRKTYPNQVMFYHAGMPSSERTDVERYFREGALRIVVATSAFGEGIDLPDVRHVVLYHLNFDFTAFNQQAGRAGRDGADAQIHLLFGESDRAINEFIIDREAPTIGLLRELYRGIKGLAHDGIVRMSYVDIARTLEFDKASDRTVARAVAIFSDERLVEIGEDDDGRYIAFLPAQGKADLTHNERFAEGEAERESFKRFCELALTAKADALERIINRPIYPQRIELRAP
ncbi:MAG: helicase-related protein [Vulcanimicrobiaceae bacterium]